MQENSKAVANCEIPKCADCGFGKGNLQPYKVKTIKKNNVEEKDLNKENTLPVNVVPADHYILWAPVRVYHTKVK